MADLAGGAGRYYRRRINMSTYQLWDIEQWPRRNQFQFFRTYEDPFFQLCGNIEVTRLYQYAKEQQWSYSLSCLYFALAAANRQEEFRLRWLDGQLVLFDRIHAGQTILAADNTFLFCYFEWEADAAAFVAKGKANIERQLASRELDPNTSQQDLIYFSVIPWISFTGLKHARRGPAGMDGIPRIVFGKMFEEGNRRFMPLSVEANHALMDGYHVGRFFSDFQELLTGL